MPRPRLEPTDELRRLVKSPSAFGVPRKEIARRIGIRSTKTLRAHYRTKWTEALWNPVPASTFDLHSRADRAMNGSPPATHPRLLFNGCGDRV